MADEDISEDEIWDDLDKYFTLAERMPGDIDTQQLMKRYGVCDTTARRIMKKLSDSEDWILLWIKDDNSGIGKRRVLRRVQK